MDRYFVHACCDPNNMLSNPEYAPEDVFVSITQDDDFTSEAGRRKAIDALRGPQDALWFSPPCTGASPWQRINLAKGGSDMANRIKQHRKLFTRLWASFVIVAIHAMEMGAQTHMDLPRDRGYWRWPRVRSFFTKYEFGKMLLDGCMYGLTAQHRQHAGKPIKKPWKIRWCSSLEYNNT